MTLLFWWLFFRTVLSPISASSPFTQSPLHRQNRPLRFAVCHIHHLSVCHIQTERLNLFIKLMLRWWIYSLTGNKEQPSLGKYILHTYFCIHCHLNTFLIWTPVSWKCQQQFDFIILYFPSFVSSLLHGCVTQFIFLFLTCHGSEHILWLQYTPHLFFMAS